MATKRYETHGDRLIAAVFYALRQGCFFPVPKPPKGATVDGLKRWGAMRHLHDRIAEYSRVEVRPTGDPHADQD